MTKKQQAPKPEILEEYVRKKEEYQDRYREKKETQAQARNRRALIRELKEDREWN